MYLRKSNVSRQYTMNNAVLNVGDTMKGLGVWISNDLKVSNQYGKAFTKAN